MYRTLTYATAHLQGKYADTIKANGEARAAHMLEVAEMLSSGLAACSFPFRNRLVGLLRPADFRK